MALDTVILAVAFGLLVGLSLGLTGGGGSILAVPLLVYGLGIELRTAVALSLAIVGVTSLFGAVIQARSGQVLWGAGAVLGLGGILIAPVGALVGAGLSDDLVVVLFAVLMLVVGGQMLRGASAAEVPVSRAWSCPIDEEGRPSGGIACFVKLLGAGGLTGFLSGLFGVGGGFLLVPALLFVGGVSMKHALATSLVAIALTSVSGFISNVGAANEIPWAMSLIFAAGALVGMQGGALLKRVIPASLLRTLFAVAVVGVGAFMVVTTFI